MFTLDTLPAHGAVRIYTTADVVTDESARFGDAARRGWVSEPGASDLEEARNYARPTVEVMLPLDDDDREVIARAVESLGAYETDDGSTLYATDGTVLDYMTDEVWTYALHAHVKHHDGVRGWVEDRVAIVAS